MRQPAMRKTLGEGYTPLIPLPRLGAALGLTQLYAKDEAANPTNSFKARGLMVAVNRAAELGARAIAIPTAGNAGSAMAAAAARHGLPAYIFMPRDVPAAFLAEMNALGAKITLVDGLITDCGALVREGALEGRWFDVSTLKEPCRIEGKKTMGFELYEHFDGALPEVVIYPTGGGTGLIGMWKAFTEMEQLGWPGVAAASHEWSACRAAVARPSCAPGSRVPKLRLSGRERRPLRMACACRQQSVIS